MAELYSLSSYDMVTVTKIDKRHEEEVLTDVSSDFMMVTIKDQFISRGEMFHYQNTLLGKWVFVDERLISLDVSAYDCNELLCLGIVVNDTSKRRFAALLCWHFRIPCYIAGRSCYSKGN